MKPKGIVAAGHSETAAAAAAILEEGGNAFDAALAALCAACIAEPVLATLGGGGFLLACPGEGYLGKSRPGEKLAGRNFKPGFKSAMEPVVYDFFVQTPRRKKPPEDTDFFPILADFGEAQQEFHMGMGSIATPGLIKGLFRIHQDLCSMPMARIVEPAVILARQGLALNALQAHILDVVGNIYSRNEPSRALFGSRNDPGKLLREGEALNLPEMADAFDALAREGADLFYRGDMAHALVEDCRTGGGHLTAADLENYQVVLRRPLETGFANARLNTNPPPSTGGILIAFALELLKDMALDECRPASADYLERLARVMELTNKARIDSAFSETGDKAMEMLEPGFLDQYRRKILTKPSTARGTTQISVMDSAGNAASMTVSNGEGAGYILPGTAIMINNMLGEEDLNPLGFNKWPENKRIGSMMAPTVAAKPDGATIVTGSGGSNRIRTAILQVLVNMLEFGLPVAEAVNHPRIHFEGGLLNLEPGFEPAAVSTLSKSFRNFKQWEKKGIFFGGAHTVRVNLKRGEFSGAGDPRRGGVTVTV